MARHTHIKKGIDSARKNLESTLKRTLADIIKPYQKDINTIQKNTAELQTSLEKLALRIGRDATLSFKAGRAEVKKIGRQTRASVRNAITSTLGAKKRKS